jgi:ABC-type glutathione transport system ATPase component
MAALDRLGLASRAGNYPDQLSGGERQRVSIARAVVGEHLLLLADEPSGALDSANGEAVMDLIRAACDRGVAAVVVTHDAHLAARAAAIVSIRDGHLVSQAGRTSVTRRDVPAQEDRCPRQLPRPRPPVGGDRQTEVPRPGARSPAGPGGCSAGSGASSFSSWP